MLLAIRATTVEECFAEGKELILIPPWMLSFKVRCLETHNGMNNIALFNFEVVDSFESSVSGTYQSTGDFKCIPVLEEMTRNVVVNRKHLVYKSLVLVNFEYGHFVFGEIISQEHYVTFGNYHREEIQDHSFYYVDQDKAPLEIAFLEGNEHHSNHVMVHFRKGATLPVLL